MLGELEENLRLSPGFKDTWNLLTKIILLQPQNVVFNSFAGCAKFLQY